MVVASKVTVLSNPKEDSIKAKHRRYNATNKGKERHARYNTSLKGIQRGIRHRLRGKLQRVAELEEELRRYDKKDSNRAGES